MTALALPRVGIAAHADFSLVRYAQCWEDADVLLEALDVQPHHVCLSIASAGDNALALLARGPRRVLALDLSPAQLACLELRVAAYRELEHAELLELYGSSPSRRRPALYRRCRAALAPDTRHFWDARAEEVAAGIGACGKFERYLACFREHILPLVHSRRTVARWFEPQTREERQEFYERAWDTAGWRALFRIFFSRTVMGRLGRDPSFFQHAAGDISSLLLERTRHGLVDLDPAANPYLQWILMGRHLTALPFALRPENFAAIRQKLNRLEWRCQSMEEFLGSGSDGPVDRFNLSDIFEYIPEADYLRLLQRIAWFHPRARLAYWNLLARRRRPEWMTATWRPLDALAARLHQADQTFFYRDFIVEERS